MFLLSLPFDMHFLIICNLYHIIIIIIIIIIIYNSANNNHTAQYNTRTVLFTNILFLIVGNHDNPIFTCYQAKGSNPLLLRDVIIHCDGSHFTLLRPIVTHLNINATLNHQSQTFQVCR